MIDSNAAVTSAKAALRDRMRQALAAMAPHEVQDASLRIGERLMSSEAWQRAGALLGFASLLSEPDLLPTLWRAAEEGRAVALPRWNPASGLYEAARVRHPADLTRGRYDIPEPAAHTPVIPLEQLDLVLVPGLAFDRSGRRLGRGKGYFDRLLARTRGALRWGVAFDVQVVDEVPSAAHDVTVHALVTPGAWWVAASHHPG